MSIQNPEGVPADALMPIRQGIGVGVTSEISEKLVRLVTNQEQFVIFDRDPVNYLVHHGIMALSSLDAAALIGLVRHLRTRVTGTAKQTVLTNHDSGDGQHFTVAQERQQKTQQQSKQKKTSLSVFHREREQTASFGSEGCRTFREAATLALLEISPNTTSYFPGQPLVSPMLIKAIRARQDASKK